MKRWSNIAAFLVFAVAICVPLGFSEDVVSDATLTDDINGSVSFLQGAGGAITVVFPEQSATRIPEYRAATVVATTSSGEPGFAGDYIASGVENVSFKIEAASTVTQPPAVRLVLRSGVSGRVWRNENVSVSVEGGVVVANQVSFDRSSGWTRDGGGDLDAMWAEDLQSVEIIGVRLAQPARQGMSYTVSEFIISGAFGTTPAPLSPLEAALKEAFGVTSVTELTDVQKKLDADADGMTDMVEILAENDDEFANSIFVAEIVSITDAGVLIKWPCVAGSSYTVIKSESLTSEFQDLPGAVRLPCTQTGFMTHLDAAATGAGPYFYKIRREQ